MATSRKVAKLRRQCLSEIIIARASRHEEDDTDGLPQAGAGVMLAA